MTPLDRAVFPKKWSRCMMAIVAVVAMEAMKTMVWFL